MDIKKIKTLLRRKLKSDRRQSSSASDSSFSTANTSPRPSTTVDSHQATSPRQPLPEPAPGRTTELNGSQIPQDGAFEHTHQAQDSSIRRVSTSSFSSGNESPSRTRHRKDPTAGHGNIKPLPRLPVEEGLASDLGHMSLGDDDRQMISPSSRGHSEDVAEPSRNHRSSIGGLSSSPTSQGLSRDSASLRRKPVGSGFGSVGSQAALDGATEKGHLAAHAEPPSLEGVVDLTNTVDTDVHEHWAPAVTHETVLPQLHHIREEQIHREIHNHTYLHRIQPVLEFEVLPARHFVPNASGQKLVEVSEDQIPECTGENQRWFIAEKRSTVTHNGRPPNGTQPLTGLELDGHDRKKYMTPEGFERTETTWVHRPVLEDTTKLQGPTFPVHFGECGEECATRKHGEKKHNRTER
ncbi:hypothetical protein BU16DRAFT_364968 [Lophium mytilinum]|uniref:Uncharacterized protein n=1 Tax=Lophium mytilinum TaxID=390894 RepID=A0A6A6QV68_9PEZI|nr:hypothetical protein BU16DRAFT_364968 [Lophium mytilinum]